MPASPADTVRREPEAFARRCLCLGAVGFWYALGAMSASVTKGKTSRLFFKVQRKSEGGQGKMLSGSPAEAEVLVRTAAAPAPLGRCAAGISTA